MKVIAVSSESWLARTQYASTSIEAPHTLVPSINQKRLPLMKTNLKVKARAETSLTRPKIPARKRDAETEVKPEDMKITGQ